MLENKPRIALAANRQLGYRVLQLMNQQATPPVALLLADDNSADEWTRRMEETVTPQTPILCGKKFRQAEGIERLRSLRLDYVISVHFPYIVPETVLQLPSVGTLNLHPAYLPYNRGWHTPSWAIAEGTPYGATLHWMDAGVDTGDIALQRQLDVRPDDTANGLYQRVLDLEFEVFRRALPLIVAGRLPRIPQTGQGTEHRKQDLRAEQPLRLDEYQPVGETLRRLRALTTNSWEEAAYFEKDGQRYRVRIEIRAEAAADRKAA